MKRPGRFDGSMSYLYARWPSYLLNYGGGTLLLLALIAWSGQQGWWGVAVLGLVAMIILAYFLAASLWAAHKLYDPPNQLDYDLLFTMGGLTPEEQFVHIGLGLRRTAVALSRRLTRGQIIALDLYNPQLTPSRTLARWRSQTIQPRADRRLVWREARLELLPLPDNSTWAVVICQTLSEFAQQGDRELLLGEVYRILQPGGRLLLSEQTFGQTQLLAKGWGAMALADAAYWQTLISAAGFDLREERVLYGLISCFRADKPGGDAARQLPLDIRFDW
jgi:ubiquinone/menaquinone biosynthesis C-methylase UbiE